MRRHSIVTALSVVAVAVGLLVGPPARGGVPAGASYLGSKMCQACHQGTNAEAVAGWKASPHSKAMWQASETDEAHKIAADFAKSAPFTKDKAAYIVGIGSRFQSFLDSDLKVLPGMWSVKSKAWQPQEAVDAKTDCLGCHTTGYDPSTAKYVELAVGCEMCHGPGSVHAGSADKKGTIVQIAQLDPAHQAMVCGSCHSRGKSKDGKYTFPAGFKPGDDLDQFFTFQEQAPQGAMNAQYNQLRFGGGKHLAAGVGCTTCHDPHGSGSMPNMLRKPINDLCGHCHPAGKLTGPQHAAETLKAVTCAACHMPGGSHAFVKPKAG